MEFCRYFGMGMTELEVINSIIGEDIGVAPDDLDSCANLLLYEDFSADPDIVECIVVEILQEIAPNEIEHLKGKLAPPGWEGKEVKTVGDLVNFTIALVNQIRRN